MCILGFHKEQFADLAAVDEFFCLDKARRIAADLADHHLGFGGLCSGNHLAAFVKLQRHRLFTQHMFLRGQCRKRDLLCV